MAEYKCRHCTQTFCEEALPAFDSCPRCHTSFSFDKPQVIEPIYGFDIGGTLALSGRSGKAWDESFRVVKRIVTELSPVSYIVSRVNEEQKIRAQAWLKDNDVCNQIGIPEDRVHWCVERKDKGPICQKLNITHFVDDRPEVMLHMPFAVRKILIKPDPLDLWHLCNELENYTVCADWLEIERLVFSRRFG